MKQTISFLLVLMMLLCLLAGCSGQSGDVQSGTEFQASQAPTQATVAAELVITDPPRTAEEFMELFPQVLASREIPVELAFFEERNGLETGRRAALDVYIINDDGSLEDARITLWVSYPETTSDPMTDVMFCTFRDTPEENLELFSVLCCIVSSLCDVNMTEEKAAELFTTNPAPTDIVTYTGDIGSFIGRAGNYSPEFYDICAYSGIFCQPVDLTHSLLKTADGAFRQYHVTFTEPGENPYAYRIVTSITVAELEAGLNDYFAAEGIPVECAFLCTGAYGSSEGEAEMRGYFRFTSEDLSGIAALAEMENLSEEDRLYAINNTIVLTDVNGYGSDALVASFEVISEDKAWSSLLLQAISSVWDAKTGHGVVPQLLAEIENIDQTERQDLDIDNYSLVLANSGRSFNLYYWPIHDTFTPPANLLDPTLLEFPFTYSDSAVQNGFFQSELFCTDIYNVYPSEVSVLDLLCRYLTATGTELELARHPDHVAYITSGDGKTEIECIPFRAIDAYESLFSLDSLGLGIVNWTEYVTDPQTGKETDPADAYMVYYQGTGTTVNYVIRSAIGLALMLDEGMTAEEAVGLHLDPPEPEGTYQNWDISMYCPREVMHLILKDNENNFTLYLMMTKATFEEKYGDWESFEANDDIVSTWIAQFY